MNWFPVIDVRHPDQTVGLCDAGLNDAVNPTLATHCFPPSATTTPSIGRPNPRHPFDDVGSVSVGFVDGHGEWRIVRPPFYPGVPGQWTGNGITDRADPEYKNHLWDTY
jgi:hypothetical protein